ADGFNDVVRSILPAASPLPAVLRRAERLNLLDETITLRTRVKRDGRSKRERERAASCNRLDNDDLRRAFDARALNGAQANRAGAKYHYVGARLDGRLRHRGAKPARTHT